MEMLLKIPFNSTAQDIPATNPIFFNSNFKGQNHN